MPYHVESIFGHPENGMYKCIQKMLCTWYYVENLFPATAPEVPGTRYQFLRETPSKHPSNTTREKKLQQPRLFVAEEYR